MTTALFIGRFQPPHKGHIAAVQNLTRQHDKVVIALGSCYTVGKSRYPFLALYREKMLLSSLAYERCDLSKIEILHVQDYKDFNDWLADILEICEQKKVTHVVTGNEEQILGELREKNMKLPFTFVNPEETSGIDFHATDMRDALLEGNYAKFSEIAAFGTKNLIANVNGFSVKEAMENIATSFLPGRQTVDTIVTLQQRVVPKSGIAFYKDYVLTGYRSQDKEQFPNMLGLMGAEIKKFESPIYAAARALHEKANLHVKIEDNTFEPAHATFDTGTGPIVVDMAFLNIYSDSREHVAGKAGGSSQCFTINVKAEPQKFTAIKDMGRGISDIAFRPAVDVLREGLAYQQSQMLEEALRRL